MPHFYIEEDEISGDIAVYDDSGAEIIRFLGENALGNALHWAKASGFDLRSNLSQEELADIYRLFYRRGLRRLRLFRVHHSHQPPKDPPNVQRIIVPDFSDFFGEDDEEMGFPYEDDPWSTPEEIELAPDDEDPT